MRILRALSLSLLFVTSPAVAQWSHDAYEPRIGFFDEIDTIYGSKHQQNLGAGMMNIGPKPGGDYGRLWLTGIHSGPAIRGKSNYYELESGPDFKLKGLRSNAREIPLKLSLGWRTAPFSTSKSRDLLDADPGSVPVIYWEDSLGNYDTSRTTRLLMRGDDKETQTFHSYGELVYNSILTSDTVQDIIAIVIRSHFSSPIPDSVFAAFYPGGAEMRSERVIYPTHSVYIGEKIKNTSWARYFTQGDWRGVGSEDLITAEPETKTYFYYAAEKPFSLERFARSLLHDTLISQLDEPRISQVVGGEVTMQAFPKSSNDRSKDLVLTLYLDGLGQVIHFFRGHSEFGTQRLTSDSAKTKIFPFKGSINDYIFDQKLRDMGDMSGTGNRVLYTSASQNGGFSTFHLFYVTGKALDDTADMVHYVEPRGRAWIDTLTANGDSLKDAILGIPDFYTYEDLDRGKTGLGTIHLIYGSKRIPVKGQSVVHEARTSTTALQAYPNPTSGPVTITLDRVRSSTLTFRLNDCLGREIHSDVISAIPGSLMTLSLKYSALASGTYILSVQDGEVLRHTKLIVL